MVRCVMGSTIQELMESKAGSWCIDHCGKGQTHERALECNRKLQQIRKEQRMDEPENEQ